MLPLLEAWPPCPGCGGPALRALHVIPNSKRLVPSPFLALLGCEGCGLVFTSPRPSPDALAAFYDKNNKKGWHRQEPDAHSEKMARKRQTAEAKLAPLGVLTAVAAGVRALDFGCGAGAMLDVLQDAGWETVGLEPSRIGTFAARRHRLIDILPAEPTFDLVVLHHVLEHVLEPGRLLREIAAACRPGARLLVGVPSLEGIAVTGDFRYACSAVHINTFTTASLANVLRANRWVPACPADVPERTRIVVHGTRAEAPLPASGAALEPAIRALRAFGRRLDASGEFTVCPLTWPEDEA